MATSLQKLQTSMIRSELAAIRKLLEPALNRTQQLQPSLALRRLKAIRGMLQRYKVKP